MSSVQSLREFVKERLTAAFEELFETFEKIIVEYEEEIDRLRKELDVVSNPDTKPHTTELPQLNVCKEEEQLCNQERSSSLDREEPEHPRIKEEQEELCPSQEGEQLVLKQETQTFIPIPVYEGDHSEPEPICVFVHSSSVAESQDQEGCEHVDSGSTRNEEPKPKKRRCSNTNYSNNGDDSPVSETQCNGNAGTKSSLNLDLIHTGDNL